jgi:outer membrane protein assembly factor BamB
VNHPKPYVFQQILVLAMAAALVAGAGGCAGRRKSATVTDKPTAVPSNSFVRQWANGLKLNAKDSVDRMYLRENTLYVYTAANEVYALGRTGGDLKYIATPAVSGGLLRPPLELDDKVIYPSGSTIDVFNNRGRQLRTIELTKSVRSSATGIGNIMYIALDHAAGTGVMAQIDVAKSYHVTNWELMTYGAIDATPILFDKTIYCASEDGRIYAVSDERGQVWSLENNAGYFQTQGKFVSDITVDDFGIFASNTDSKLYCLDRGNGHIKWQYYAGVPLKTAPAVTATMVYQYVEGMGIVAIDKANGTFNRAPKWVMKTATQLLSEDQQYAYLRRRDGRLVAVDKASGQIAFVSNKHPFDVLVTNTKDATIYGATKNGMVWAVRPVLHEGEVGSMVMDFRVERLETLAMAR